jgi:broad specificity phosphatase PhoE
LGRILTREKLILLFLVRHSQSEIVPDLPANQWGLSEEGQRRCQALAIRLSSYRPTQFFSSPEPKALKTARLISASLPITILRNLREHERHHVPFTTPKQFEESVCELFTKPNTLVFGNETANEAFSRFSETISHVLRKHPADRNVFVAHGTVISLFISNYTGVDPISFWRNLAMPSLIVVDGPGLNSVEVINDFS